MRVASARRKGRKKRKERVRGFGEGMVVVGVSKVEVVIGR